MSETPDDESRYAIEILAMAAGSDPEEGTHIAEFGETIVEYSVLCKEYEDDGEITIHFDEEFPTFDAASIAAFPWEQKWEVSAEHIGG